MSENKYKNGSYIFEINEDMPSAEIQLFAQKIQMYVLSHTHFSI